jgi:peptidyl-tRNA hydrolase
MGAQAAIGTDGGEDNADRVLVELPPEKLLETNDVARIRGGVHCMQSVETVKQYVAHENATDQRERILRLLQQRAAELHDQE